MKLSLDCPTKMLPAINPLCDFDYINLKRFISDNTYKEFFSTVKENKLAFMLCSGNEPDVILNSIGELKRPCFLIVDNISLMKEKLPEPFKSTLISCVSSVEPQEAFDTLEDAPNTVGFFDGVAGNRALFIKSITGYEKANGIILLGLRDTKELFWYKNFNTNFYLTTSLPVIRGLEGKDISEESDVFSFDGLEKVDMNKAWPGILSNIAYLRKLIS